MAPGPIDVESYRGIHYGTCMVPQHRRIAPNRRAKAKEAIAECRRALAGGPAAAAARGELWDETGKSALPEARSA